MTYISWSSEFALCLKNYLMDCFISWRLFDLWTSYFGIMGQYDQTFDLKINICHCDLYFMVQWFCLMSKKLFDGWVSHFQIMRQGDPNFDLKINVGQHDLLFHGLMILLNILDYLMDEGHSWYNRSVWHKDWPHQVYVGQWPLFYGPVILHHILKTIWWRNVVLGIMDQCDTKIDLVKCLWVSDLYFTVHWFCLLSLLLTNYFYTLRNGAGRGYLCPSWHCSRLISSIKYRYLHLPIYV